MTAHSSSPVAESASSTIDPDAQARRANDGELSAGFQSDVTIDEVAADGALTAEEFPNERFDESVDSTQLYAEYRRLVHVSHERMLDAMTQLTVRGLQVPED